ncbi:hypothetical protein [Actinoallomurus iriomotensis]|uniref:hypothetical protein n=1 Tax=Actinoallomurus iriomotensis TaxID=478107 RepID=UPI0025527DF9|nr:hypothetical protein [Actinoallomurus iriomotensis]
MSRDGHSAILLDANRQSKESEVAAGDIAPVTGERFEQTLASASPSAAAPPKPASHLVKAIAVLQNHRGTQTDRR